MSAEISAGWGPPVTLGAQRPAGGAATSRFATELRPLSVGRGFFVLAEERKDEPASRAGVTRIPL